MGLKRSVLKELKLGSLWWTSWFQFGTFVCFAKSECSLLWQIVASFSILHTLPPQSSCQRGAFSLYQLLWSTRQVKILSNRTHQSYIIRNLCRGPARSSSPDFHWGTQMPLAPESVLTIVSLLLSICMAFPLVCPAVWVATHLTYSIVNEHEQPTFKTWVHLFLAEWSEVGY